MGTRAMVIAVKTHPTATETDKRKDIRRSVKTFKIVIVLKRTSLPNAIR